MRIFIRILLLAIVLSLGITGTGIQPAQAQKGFDAEIAPGTYVGKFHVILYEIMVENATVGPITTLVNDVFNLDIEGKVTITVKKDRPDLARAEVVPVYTTFYKFRMVNASASGTSCSSMGYLDGEAKLNKLFTRLAGDEFWALIDNAPKIAAQQYSQKTSGTLRLCGDILSEEILNTYVKKSADRLLNNFIHLGIYVNNAEKISGATYVGRWDTKTSNQYGYMEDKVSGTWWARKITSSGNWGNRGKK
jgi:hypothetical protein